MPRDEIYTEQNAGTGTFEFSEAIADGGPNMLQRSMPGYEASIRAIRALARQYVQPESVAMHTELSDRAEYQCAFPSEENSLCKQRSSMGASAFVNSQD